MKADADRSARWQRLHYQDENLLLSLAESTGDLGDIALNAMTHLPLRIASWRAIRSRLQNRILVAETSERRRYLERVLRWVPRVEPQDVAADVSRLPTTELNHRLRGHLDIPWMEAPAPGCVLLSDVELTRAVARSKGRVRELRQLAEALSVHHWQFDAAGTSSIGELDPHTVTALFALLPASEVWIVNSLVSHIAGYSQFRPELRGLFRVYWRTLATYAKETKRPLDLRLLDDRDDEAALCWRAWQIAWCVSRGGIANVVAGLQIELGSSDLNECAAAIALIADAADYCVQPEPALFGGGAAPERLAPNSPFLIVSEAPSGGVAHPGPPGNMTEMRGEAEPGTEPKQGGWYVVWFATNRQPVLRAGVATGFSATRDHAVHYGWCRVSIPVSHQIGSIGSPWWRRLLTVGAWRRLLTLRAWRDDPLTLTKLVTTSVDEHWAQISRALKRQIGEERAALVFIHGYNVSFAEAAIRAAQLGFDLSFKGAMAFYSWPSRGTFKGYASDESSIEASEGYITDYLVDMAAKTQAARVHVLAHSMGNRGVLRAVDRIAASASKRSATPFDQIVLAAADVDQDTFRRLSIAYQAVARRTTMYVCDKDRAVEASSWLHGYPRAGLTPPVIVVPGIDTINVSNLDLTMLGHGYVAEARAVLEDMYYVLRNTPPEDRFALRPATTAHGEPYWIVGG